MSTTINVLFANILGGHEYTGTTYGDLSFGDDIIDEYARIIGEQQPDIVSLAEVHLDNRTHSEHATKLAQVLGMPYYDIQGTDKSHLVEGKLLGNAVFSKYPITATDHFLIKAPTLEVKRPNGDHWVMHDKGAQTVRIDINRRTLSLTNLHYFPFHHFLRASNDPTFTPERNMLVDYLTKVEDRAVSIVTGDFNNKGLTLKEAFPELFDTGFAEAIEADTTIMGGCQQFDHILYKPEQAYIVNAEIVDIPSDHFALKATVALRD